MFDTKRKIAVGIVVAMFALVWFANRQAVNNIATSDISRPKAQPNQSATDSSSTVPAQNDSAATTGLNPR